jgi:hypothetical protein
MIVLIVAVVVAGVLGIGSTGAVGAGVDPSHTDYCDSVPPRRSSLAVVEHETGIR